MKPKKFPDLCLLCGGNKKAGTTTFTAELGTGVVVVRNVPGTVCRQCGADWLDNRMAKRLEKIVDDARKKRLQLEVISLD